MRLTIALWCLVGMATQVSAASPSLTSISPRGGQRGTEVELRFGGNRLGDAVDVLFYEAGFELASLKAENAKDVRARVKIAADCRLGVHSMRVRTKSGISELRTFFVGALPAAPEKEPNSDFAEPQKVSLNATIDGVVESEDVDYYAFDAKKGQRVTAEIEAMRLGVSIFDPYIALLDSARFELASCDDSALLKQDAVCQAIIPKDGTYYLQVRESSYGGGSSARYRVHLGTFARPTAVYPAGAKEGTKVDLRLLGDASGEIQRTIEKPSLDLDGVFVSDDAGFAPSPNPFRVSPYENVLEV